MAPVTDQAGNTMIEEEANRTAEEAENTKEYARSAALRANADLNLSLHGISTHALAFDDFAREVWSSTRKRVDLVVSVIPTNIKSELQEELPEFCQSVLKTGSSVFIIVREGQFRGFLDKFQEQGFKVCDHGFYVQYNSSALRK